MNRAAARGYIDNNYVNNLLNNISHANKELVLSAAFYILYSL